jgi:hypothetical protein
MKATLIKVAFTTAVLFLTILLAFPAMVLLETLFTAVVLVDGHYRSSAGAGLFGGLIGAFGSFHAAHWLMSLLLRALGVPEDMRPNLLKQRRLL